MDSCEVSHLNDCVQVCRECPEPLQQSSSNGVLCKRNLTAKQFTSHIIHGLWVGGRAYTEYRTLRGQFSVLLFRNVSRVRLCKTCDSRDENFSAYVLRELTRLSAFSHVRFASESVYMLMMMNIAGWILLHASRVWQCVY